MRWNHSTRSDWRFSFWRGAGEVQDRGRKSPTRRTQAHMSRQTARQSFLMLREAKQLNWTFR